MENRQKQIAICLTNPQEEYCRHFLDSLLQKAQAENIHLVVFSSPLDFYQSNTYEKGATAVYSLMNFDLLDGLFILDNTFMDKQLVKSLIAKAQQKNIPVVVLSGEYSGCYSILPDFDQAFGDLIRHVLDVHTPTDIRLIAGAEGSPDTEKKLAICKDIMQQYNKELSDAALAYCDNSADAVKQTVDTWIAAKKIPDCIICASDIMAAAACDQLQVHGYRVPEDVIVTGFGNLPSLSLHTPALTTCSPNMTETTDTVFHLFQEAWSGDTAPHTVPETYKLVLSESCGCTSLEQTIPREDGALLSQWMASAYEHESFLYSWVNRLLADDETDLKKDTLEQIILPNSLLLLNQEHASKAVLLPKDIVHPFTKQLAIINGPGSHVTTGTGTLAAEELLPTLEATASSSMTILQSVYINDRCCGCIAVHTDNIHRTSHLLHRLVHILNLAFSVVDSRNRHAHAMAELMQA